MSETPIFGFRLVGVNTTEAGKAASANENALIAEALFKQRVESRTTATPPGSPTNAIAYIVPDADASPAPSGAWAGHEDEIAIYYNGWLFVAPINGPVFYVADEDLSVKYDDTASPPAWVVGGESTFIGQSDTPASYSGQAGKAAVVNGGETGLEFSPVSGGWGRETAQATTSGTAFDFGSLPAGLDVIIIPFHEVSLDGADTILIQIGDSGGLETSGYLGTGNVLASSGAEAGNNSTAGFPIYMTGSGAVLSANVILTRIDGNEWVASHDGKQTTTTVNIGGGSKTLSGELDRLRITRAGSTNFDAGKVNVLHQ